MMSQQRIVATGWLVFGLILAVFLTSCQKTTSSQRQSLNPKDPNYLTEKYLTDLREGNNARRTEAAWTLGKTYIKRTPEVVPALIQALNDPYPKVRANAAGALSNLGDEARPAEFNLRQALHDSYGKTGLNAAIALRNLHVPDKELIPAVRKVLNDQLGTTRVAAAGLLRIMGILDEESIAVLVEVLSDSDVQARLDAFGELHDRKLKPIPQKVSGPVISRLRDESDQVRIQAALYLGNSPIPILEARQTLIATLDDPSDDVVKFAARAVGKYGKSAKEAVPKLTMLLKTNNNDGTRGEACQVLALIGEPRKEIAQTLVHVLTTDPGPDARRGAASGLRDLKSRDQLVLEALKTASTKDKDSSVRTISQIAYGQLKNNN
ncbi:MAG: HEAT repeat domain-containing protein [Proteobacteria bacterium]|nr:HEAT repeat domain-containing protein [Pseudomonadota bacterium]